LPPPSLRWFHFVVPQQRHRARMSFSRRPPDSPSEIGS